MPAGSTVPPDVADLSKRQQATFERDFQRAAQLNPTVRKAGRTYFAFGWRAFYDAVQGHQRRRKAPGEWRIRNCPCAYHVKATDGPEDDDGPETTTGDPAGAAWATRRATGADLITDPATGERMTLAAYIEDTADFDD